MAIDEPSPPQSIGGSGDNQGRRSLRQISRRQGLPTGRAVVGGLLVTLSILGLYFAWQQSQEGPTTTYLVARTTIPGGERIEDGDLVERVLELPEDLQSITFTASQRAQVVGSVAKVDLAPGQLIQSATIFQLAAGETLDTPPAWEFSISIPEERALSGGVLVGEFVDLVATLSVQTLSSLDDRVRNSECTFVAATELRVVQVDGAGSVDFGSGGEMTLLLATENPQGIVWSALSHDLADMHLVRTGKAGDVSLEGTSTCGLDPTKLSILTPAQLDSSLEGTNDESEG